MHLWWVWFQNGLHARYIALLLNVSIWRTSCFDQHCCSKTIIITHSWNFYFYLIYEKPVVKNDFHTPFRDHKCVNGIRNYKRPDGQKRVVTDVCCYDVPLTAMTEWKVMAADSREECRPKFESIDRLVWWTIEEGHTNDKNLNFIFLTHWLINVFTDVLTKKLKNQYNFTFIGLLNSIKSQTN